jgi:hypothetical protein
MRAIVDKAIHPATPTTPTRKPTVKPTTRPTTKPAQAEDLTDACAYNPTG